MGSQRQRGAQYCSRIRTVGNAAACVLGVLGITLGVSSTFKYPVVNLVVIFKCIL